MTYRVTLIAALVALAVPATAQARQPLLSARLASCQVGVSTTDRGATFVGSMPATAGTRRMAMRFELQRRAGALEPWTTVSVPGLGAWQRSLPGKPGFIFRQRVEELAVPASYRAVVRFRWYGRNGRVLASARRETRACRQPDLRPDLRAGQLSVRPGPLAGSSVYELAIRNVGASAAAAFDVVLSVAGIAQPAQRLGGLEPKARETVSFIAATCEPGSALRFTIDAASEVAESVESTNVVDVACH